MKNPLGVDGTVNWMRKISSDATISIWASDLLEIVDTLTSRERSRAERAEAERDALRDELARMSDEFADVLEVAIARGAALGYDSDSDYIQRWEELTGDEWVEE